MMNTLQNPDGCGGHGRREGRANWGEKEPVGEGDKKDDMMEATEEGHEWERERGGGWEDAC